MEDLQPAITSQTAMVYTTWRDERIERILKVTKPAGVPVLLDDAAGMTMQPGEDLLVGNRLRQILDKARKQSV